MPKPASLFSSFPDLENISVQKVEVWTKHRYDVKLLENKLGNRLLYPQTVPVSEEDLSFDLALLREALRLHPYKYYNQNLRRIYIPQELLDFVGDVGKVAQAFLDAFRPQGATSVLLSPARFGTKSLGTIIRPEISENRGEISIWVQGRIKKLAVGELVSLPVQTPRVDFRFYSQMAKLMGKNDISLEVAGGELGLLIDARE